MKTMLAILALTLFLSTNAYADKAEIAIVWSGGDVTLHSCDEMGCTFACDTAFMATAYAHKDNALSLQLIIDEEDAITLTSYVLPESSLSTRIWNSGCFCIPESSDFSMVWVLENTKTGRIIDAEEAYSGTCIP